MEPLHPRRAPSRPALEGTGEVQVGLLRALSSPWFHGLWAAVGTKGSLPLGVVQAAWC